MKLFGAVMELAIFLPTPQSGQWLCSLEYQKSFPNINKKFFLRLLFSGHYNFLLLNFCFDAVWSA